MKLFLDTKARRFVKSAASNVALQTLHLKRRDQVPLEIVFVANNAVVTAPTGTATTVGLKAKFSDANFLAFAAPGTNTLNLNTEPVEAAFSSNPASLPALLEVRWSAPGESLRTATLQVELQNSVILGTEGTPTAIPDLKATQAQAEAGTSNETWITPLRAWDAIRAWAAANFSWANLAGKPTSFPPSSHTHPISEVTGLSTALADTNARLDSALANLDPAAIDSISEAVTVINTERAERIAADTALQSAVDSKAATVHTHTASQITDFSAAVVAAAPPTTDASLLTSGTLADARLSATVTASLAKADTASQPGHGHSISDVANLATALAEKATVTSVTTVSEALTAESQARATADSSLQTALDTKASISDFQDADNFINGRVDQEILDRAAAITTEASTRAAADTALDQRIDFLAENLDPAALDSIAEAAASIGSLQTQIDGKAPTSHTHPAFTYNSPGFVPNSFGAEAGKFLRGDGTWQTPQSEISNVNGLQTALDTEAQTRATADANLQTQIDGKQPTGNYVTRTDVQSGGSSYFERSSDAASQNIGQGQSVHQLVLANDTRLADARRVQWFTAPPNFYTVPNGATAGAMAYDGSFLYLLVPYGPTSLRWARSPMTTTW
jgi:hypothetical protein